MSSDAAPWGVLWGRILWGLLLIVGGWALIGSTLNISRADAIALCLGILALVQGFRGVTRGELIVKDRRPAPGSDET